MGASVSLPDVNERRPDKQALGHEEAEIIPSGNTGHAFGAMDADIRLRDHFAK